MLFRSIKYYPNGSTEAKDDDISLYLFLKSKSVVKAQFGFTILDQSGCALAFNETSEFRSFKTDSYWGYPSFVKKAVLESNIKNDCFIIKCVVTVFKDFPVEPTANIVIPIVPTEHIVIPPGNIQQQLGHLLDNGNGADVTFEVDGQILCAHKCILATRSPVFLAQFFGPMKEKSDATIKIEEMEAPVFKEMLHFIYNDSFPELEEKEGSDEKQETKLMAQELLVAANRYGLERLKVICEKKLCGSINTMPCNSVKTGEVVTLLVFAGRHGCNHLKAVCLKFLATPGILRGVAATEQFQYLVKNDPLILKEILEKQS